MTGTEPLRANLLSPIALGFGLGAAARAGLRGIAVPALAITFPFDILAGIPVHFWMARP